MIPILYVIAVALLFLSIGLAGIASDKHLVIILFCVELMLVGSVVALSGFFSNNPNGNPDAFLMLISIFAVAATEVIALVALYMFIRHRDANYNVRSLSRLKW